MGLISKKAEQTQKAAYEAHVRGKKALDEGDIFGAIVNDDEARVLAIEAMLLRMRARADT